MPGGRACHYWLYIGAKHKPLIIRAVKNKDKLMLRMGGGYLFKSFVNKIAITFQVIIEQESCINGYRHDRDKGIGWLQSLLSKKALRLAVKPETKYWYILTPFTIAGN